MGLKGFFGDWGIKAKKYLFARFIRFEVGLYSLDLDWF